MKSLVAQYFVREVLESGLHITIRAIGPSDKPLLLEGMHHLSSQSQYFRFFAPKSDLTEKELKYFTELDFVRHVGLVAVIEKDGKELPAGVARYIVAAEKAKTPIAEIAFAVGDQYQGLGIGFFLLKHLTKIARQEGLKLFNCYVLVSNIKMLKLLSNSKLPMKRLLNYDGVYEIILEL